MYDDEPLPRSPDDIESHELESALADLSLMDDMFLRMQITNLTVTDQVLMDLEMNLLRRKFEEERTPIDDAVVLLAFSQMWIFAAYELLRTWRARVKEFQKWKLNCGFEAKIAALEAKGGAPLHLGRQIRIDQLKRARDEPDLLAKLDADLRRTHILFKRLEGVRVWLSKHEVVGKRNSIAAAPGLSLINRYTGSLEFELSHDSVILDTVSRRDIADHMRAIPGEPQTAEELAAYDEMMADLYSTDARALFEAGNDSHRGESEGEV
ncbi:MAG: hypothetical protein WDM79_01990 [Terricaulis sp.]